MRVNRGVFGKWGVVSLAIVALTICFTGAAFAQITTGTLTGTITDQKGLAMTGVMVVVHSEDIGADMRPVTTNEAGLYVVPQLPAGTYDVTAAQPGFATIQQKGIVLGVATTVRIDLEMPVATQQSLVTVTTEVPVLETEKTEQSQNVSESLVADLPVSSRRWEQFVQLTPGLTPDGALGQFSFHGINSNYNNNSVDGANNMSLYNANSRGGTSDGYTYSGDSVREFQVESGSFNAELGQAAGGSVNAITKSGTAQYHGDLFYNGRTTPFNAYDPVSKFTAADSGTIPGQPVRQQDQWGGSLGGALIKDKLFFFVTDDGYRRVYPDISTSATPTYSSFYPAGCPQVAAFTSNPGGVTQGTMNALCASALNFANTNLVGTFGRTIRQDIELVKLDYQINQSNHFSAVGNIRDWKEPTSLLAAGLQTSGSTQGTNYLQDRFAIGTLNTVIGSNKVNELRYQYGVDNTFVTLNENYGLPSSALSNLFTYGQPNGLTHTDEFRNQVSDNFSWTMGTHTIKFGVDINVIEDNARSSTNSGGLYSYTGATLPTGVCPAGANTTFCDWLLDSAGINIGDGKTGEHWSTYSQVVDNVFSGPPQTFQYDFYSENYALYVQDTWKARPNLTINYGLRWDEQALPVPPYSSANVLGPKGLDQPILDHYTTQIKDQLNAFQPRVGVAWNLKKNTVVRFGGGFFFGNTVGSAIKTIVSGAGESNINCSGNVTPASLTGLCTGLAYPDVLTEQQNVPVQSTPVYPGAILGTALDHITFPVTGPLVGIRGIDPNALRPEVYEAEAGIEQQLPWNMNLSVTYSFTRGVHLPSQEDANIGGNFDPNLCTTTLVAGSQSCGETLTKTYDVVNSTGATQVSAIVPFYGASKTAGDTYSARYDALTGPIITQFSDVLSTYNGMVITLRKPVGRGLEVLANYTLSRATDDGQAGVGISAENFLSTDGVIDPHNRTLEYGPSSTDVPNRFTASVVYAPPFAKNLNGKVEKALLDGWNVSSTILASQGAHYSGTVQSSSNETLTTPGYLPGFVCVPVAPATTCPATNFTYTGLDGGMSGVDIQTTGNNFGGRVSWQQRNSFELPALYNVDFRLTKVFAIKEKYNIELRGEAFNLFNNTLVQAVSANEYTYANPSGSTGTCPATGPNAHTNTCMVPVSSFQTPTTTTGLLLGPRQLQAGVRFEF
jgi:hypothetical protein